VKSEATDVATYLEGVPEERREALTRLRELCVAELGGYDECMEYGMPCYKRDGVLEVSFASQKLYIALYVMKGDVVERYREALAGCSVGKGCIRFQSPARMDFNLIRRMLKDTVKSSALPCV
jgi:uncharacterized protein YdhG (YjbR/CyaY superfamily)